VPKLTNKRVLAWRGAGVLGFKLCERLLTDAHRIYYLHNLATGGAPNIAYFARHPHFNFIYDALKPITARATVALSKS
jgi:hypothetical protein